MNVVDSSGWLEYFADGPNASWIAPAIEDFEALVVPTVSIYEVYKKVFMERGEAQAEIAIAAMCRGKVVNLDPGLARSAAIVAATLKLPMADSIILATARAASATLWTQDSDFEGLPGLNFRPKPTSTRGA